MTKAELKNKGAYTFDDLCEIVRILRAPDGCPWDRVQTHESLRNNFIEEAYEVVEGIDRKDNDIRREELGDVLWYVAETASAMGWDLNGIAMANIEKLQARYGDGFSPDKSLFRKE